MKVVFGIICLALAAAPALAGPVATPTPVLGGGLATMAILGGTLLAARLFKRK